CAEILRRHPVAAGVDPGFEIDDGGSFDRLFELESARFLATELGPRGRRGDLWERVVTTHGSPTAVLEVAGQLGGFRLPARTPVPGRSAMPESLALRLRGIQESIVRTRGRATHMNPRMDGFLASAQIFLAAAREKGPAALKDARAPWAL